MLEKVARQGKDFTNDFSTNIPNLVQVNLCYKITPSNLSLGLGLIKLFLYKHVFWNFPIYVTDSIFETHLFNLNFFICKHEKIPHLLCKLNEFPFVKCIVQYLV